MKKLLLQQNTFTKISFIVCALTSFFVNAQLKKDFTPRYSETLNGDFTMIANNVLSRDATDNYNGTESNHDFDDNVFVDIDSDPTTFNSSSANLANPAPGNTCMTIERVFLYWSAADKEYEVDGGGNVLAGDGGIEPAWNYNEIKMMLPGSTTYDATLTADEVIYRGRDEHFVNDPYICVKDITSWVQGLSDPFGKYQVANVKATEGRLLGHDGGNVGTSGGWQIVFVYQSPTLPQKNITLFDGYAHITAAQNNFDVTFNGFQTVPNGQVKANMVIGSFEGDRGISQDQLLILNTNGIWEPLSTPMRLADNFFNSSITTYGTDFLDRMPASTNTLGYDAALFDLENSGNRLITNNQTSAVVRMTSNQETYGLYLLGMAVEVWEPSLNQLELYAMASNENPRAGETVQIYLDVANTGNDNIRDLTFTTTIPPEMEFVSVEPLPAEITYNFDSNTRELTFTVADGYTDVSGAPYTIQYALRVQDDSYFAGLPACTFESSSQTLASFSGEINTTQKMAYSSFTFDDCGVGNEDATIINISITDVQAPTFDGSLPSDITVECDEVPDPAVLTATDYCDMNPIVTFDETATNNRDCTTGYEITRTWTATDDSGNSLVHTQIITVNGNPCLMDIEAPVFVEELPMDITVDCDNVPDAEILTAIDNCDMDPEVTFTETATNNRDCATGYEITRTWTATDDSGNSLVHTQIITVNGNPCLMDIEAPVFVEELPMDITVDCDNVPDAEILTAIDNCDMDPDVTFTETATNDRDCTTGYEITRTWTAIDDAGNQMSHTQIIIVNADMPCNLDDLVVSKTITSNGDGINDLFEITGLEACNYIYKLKIFNRWGNIVYESNDYKNDWGGFAPDNSLGNSGMLPSGTYYYIIGFNDLETQPVSGYIYIGSNI
ncbi:gliding motility-associated C-terminal domain-containing protein [Maribacter algicola]|uniref:Gliding motility-associated C-terminal domain-containing protein n=1 Tax=Meishania litoralis TaxID=3434685 RepID=A0ACC7LMH9_9FLAO